MADRDTLAALVEELGLALQPLATALESPDRFIALMLELGWDLAAIPQPIADLAPAVTALTDALEAGEVDVDTVATVLQAIRGVLDAVRGIASQPDSSFPATIDIAAFKSQFPQQLVDYLIVQYLLRNQSRCGHLLKLLGVVRLEPVAAAGQRPEHVRRTIAWTGLERVLEHPAAVFQDAYQWGSPGFLQSQFAVNVAELARAWGLKAVFGWLDAAAQTLLTAGATVLDSAHQSVLQVPLFDADFAVGDVTAGVGLFPLPPTAEAMPGFAVLPYLTGLAEQRFDLSEAVTLVVEGGFDAAGGVGILVRPRQPIQVLIDIISSAAGGTSPPTSAQLTLALETHGASSESMVVVGSREGSRFEIRSASTKGGARIDSTGKVDAYVEVALQGGRIVVSPSDGEADGFISSLLPSDGIVVDAELVIGFGCGSAEGVLRWCVTWA
jgi:hypothetical protein